MTSLGSPPQNAEPCGVETGDGCLQVYPRFDGIPGSLCMKCKKARAAETAEQRATIVADFKSCQGCGLCSTQLTEVFCGKCKRKEAEEEGLPNPKDLGATQRLESLRKKLGKPTLSPLQQITNLAPFGPTTAASDLEAIRAAKSSNGNTFTVVMAFRTQGTVDKMLGNHTFVLDVDLPLEISRAKGGGIWQKEGDIRPEFGKIRWSMAAKWHFELVSGILSCNLSRIWQNKAEYGETWWNLVGMWHFMREYGILNRNVAGMWCFKPECG
ncbi:hypothetical protein B0H10DRAFT_1956864 [Mycena sp. CBHHK59/15]|nr:hypothetical protein B0H10DRAFT_1956864 [Mycena sp. CBHHK59/15]